MANVLAVGLEPTGGYEKAWVKQLIRQQQRVFLVHPNRLKHVQKAQGCGRHIKPRLLNGPNTSNPYHQQLTPLGEEHLKQQGLRALSQ